MTYKFHVGKPLSMHDLITGGHPYLLLNGQCQLQATPFIARSEVTPATSKIPFSSIVLFNHHSPPCALTNSLKWKLASIPGSPVTMSTAFLSTLSCLHFLPCQPYVGQLHITPWPLFPAWNKPIPDYPHWLPSWCLYRGIFPNEITNLRQWY